MNSDLYLKRGVSADKQDVHAAIVNMSKGIFANTFCKILPDVMGGDNAYCNALHSDTAGTKTILAYLYWRETGDYKAFEGLVQDAIVMNIDDMACSGITNDFLLSSTILRNKNLIDAQALKVLIESQLTFAQSMKTMGINVSLAGGETADVGDVCRTLDVGFTAAARVAKNAIINIDIQPDDVVVGIASYGQASYETTYNSGIGCNGLTSARHDLLNKSYLNDYPESYDPNLDRNLLYIGKHKLSDTDHISGSTIGEMLLSPTRTYLPLIHKVLESHRDDIHAIIHNTGGGMTKVLHFIENMHIIKNNLLPVPRVFELLNGEQDTYPNEMWKVFNMGCRLEFYCNATTANSIIAMAEQLHIDAKIIGKCERSNGKKVTIIHNEKEFEFI
jgi:phosphoribosylformylglycinamidine cyclo-ligase